MPCICVYCGRDGHSAYMCSRKTTDKIHELEDQIKDLEQQLHREKCALRRIREEEQKWEAENRKGYCKVGKVSPTPQSEEGWTNKWDAEQLRGEGSCKGSSGLATPETEEGSEEGRTSAEQTK